MAMGQVGRILHKLGSFFGVDPVLRGFIMTLPAWAEDAGKDGPQKPDDGRPGSVFFFFSGGGGCLAIHWWRNKMK